HATETVFELSSSAPCTRATRRKWRVVPAAPSTFKYQWRMALSGFAAIDATTSAGSTALRLRPTGSSTVLETGFIAASANSSGTSGGSRFAGVGKDGPNWR